MTPKAIALPKGYRSVRRREILRRGDRRFVFDYAKNRWVNDSATALVGERLSDVLPAFAVFIKYGRRKGKR